MHQKDTLYNQAVKQLSSISTLKQNAINQWLKEEKMLVELLANVPIIKHNAIKLLTGQEGDAEYKKSYEVLLKYLQRVPGDMKDISRISILSNIGGREVISSDASAVGRYHLTDSFFTRGAKSTYVQKIYYSAINNEPSMVVATPLRDEKGNGQGVLYVLLDPTFITSLMKENPGLGKSGETMLVDMQRHIVTPHFTDEFKQKKIMTAAIEQALQYQSGSMVTKNHKGRMVLSVYKWLEEPRVVLLSEIEHDEVYAPLHGFLALLVISSIIITAISFGIARMLSSRLAKPIIILTDVAERISLGDFDVKAPEIYKNEIGVLANVFNKMTESLTTTISEKDDALASLEETNVALERASRAKSIFLANMSHELRTPLHAIIGFSQVMEAQKEHMPNAAWVEYVTSINTAGKHLLTLISDLLDFSKIEQGKLELKEAEVEIQRIVSDIRSIIRPIAESQNNELIINIPDDIGNMVTDAARVKQILLNLLGNAEKFTKNGLVSLSVQAAHENNIEYIVFTVTDTGIGISAEQLDLIFGTFTQADSSNTRKYGGVGLGLAITKEICTAMSGSVGVESKEGVGSVFTVKLPRYFTKSDQAAIVHVVSSLENRLL